LEIGPPFAPLSLNYVAAVRRTDGTRAVLKAIPPHPPHERAFACEAEALRLFHGRGGVRLLDTDAGREVLLIERCEPGTLLRDVSNVDDDRAVALACDVMRGLWQPPPPAHPFRHMDDWNAALLRLRPTYGGGTGPFPAALIAAMESLLPALIATAPAPTLLHGDLHHDNILAANGGTTWRAIDPKGLIGDPAYEVAAMLYNPNLTILRSPDPARLLARRVDGLAAGLGLERERVRGWGVVRATLVAWWGVEGGAPLEGWSRDVMTCAELLAAMKER
jgi:streptomycin 6-kinase